MVIFYTSKRTAVGCSVIWISKSDTFEVSFSIHLKRMLQRRIKIIYMPGTIKPKYNFSG